MSGQETPALAQYLCATCGRYSKPASFTGEGYESGMVDTHVEGCWVIAGYNCPTCSEGRKP